MAEVENINLGFIPQDAPQLPGESSPTSTVSYAGTQFEYLKRGTTLGIPTNVTNAVIDNLYVPGELYAPSIVGAITTAISVIGGIGSIKQLNVTGISTLENLYVRGFVGIATTNPVQRVDIIGGLKVDNLIYDRDNDAGSIGWFLTRDSTGIRWTSIAPGFGGNIIVLEEGNAITGSTGISSFSGINFLSGSGANAYDLVDLQVNPTNPLYADITIKDYWTKNGTAIYRNSNVGINNQYPNYPLDVVGIVSVTGQIHATDTSYFYKGLNVLGIATFFSNLNVAGITSLSNRLFVTGQSSFTNSVNITGVTTVANNLFVTGITSLSNKLNVYQETNLYSTLNVNGVANLNSALDVDGATTLNSTLDVDGGTTLNSTLDVDGATTLNNSLDVDGITTLNNTLDVDGATTLNSTLDVDGATTLNSSLDVDGITTLNNNLDVDGTSVFNNTVELNSSLIDINNSTATGKFDYRLSSVGTGVSWRPPGVQTQNAIWVTMDGSDSNSGYLEGDAKRTVGAAASIAEPGDTIFIRSGVYYENNPIGLRTDVSVSGQDLRLVTIIPNNPTKDVFHVRRGCLIENLNFAGSSVSVAHTGCGAVAFPPTQSDVNAGIAFSAITGYTSFGPATEGSSGRWRSPYVRNCTNFMTKSIGMRIDGNHATASTIGADLKSMVCDSFTQYNENGIGVSITNNGYAQLVSIFTINCDIGIYAASGGSCDLTNSNSSFGNFGLVAVGLGATEFTGKVNADTDPEVDTVVLKQVYDGIGTARRPYDGQALWFKINLDNYPDAVGVGTITAPLQELSSITVLNGGSGYSAAAPPNVIIRDADGTVQPKGPQGIIAEVSPTINDAGQIVAIDVISTGRNYLSSQNIVVDVDGNTGLATAVMAPIYYTVSVASSTTPSPSGITTVTFNEFIPYELFENDPIELKRISRILTSSHSFEYIGTGTDINTATPLKGAVPIKANEVVARDGAQIPFTSTDQKGNFDIGEGIQIDQTTSTIRGRDFSRAIQAEVTPLILALR